MSKKPKFLGDPCPVCGDRMFKGESGKQTCLRKWKHRTIADIEADIKALEIQYRQRLGYQDQRQPTEDQAGDAAYWLDNPYPLMIEAIRKRLDALRAELAYRQSGGPPRP